MGIHGYLWDFMGINGDLWDFMGILKGFLGNSWVFNMNGDFSRDSISFMGVNGHRS